MENWRTRQVQGKVSDDIALHRTVETNSKRRMKDQTC